ncbi:uncharacterized protein LOC115315277 isoform X1 [Ixodes scapularis]|uniref:uncharacterized protein LOC115315277 isoform X1 n=1 Tax=Ixodes scapularis TaxID=6945 RepID=UPI001A9F3244|nr:uncharacterized protein LOC115315277 isoform X1 [Ixodes scapularis]
MVRYCSVPGCKSYATDKGISFHRYPTDPLLRRKWIDALKVRLFQSPFASVCSKHFKREAYREPPPYLPKGVWGKRGTLKPLAVPSENLPRHGWNLRSRNKKMVKSPKATMGRMPRPCVRLKLSRRIQVDLRKPTRTKATFHFVWRHSKGHDTTTISSYKTIMFQRMLTCVPWELDGMYGHKRFQLFNFLRNADKLHLIINPLLWVKILSFFVSGDHLPRIYKPMTTKIFYLVFLYNENVSPYKLIDIINFINVCQNLRLTDIICTKNHILLCVENQFPPHTEVLCFLDEITESYINTNGLRYGVWGGAYNVLDNLNEKTDNPLQYRGLYESPDSTMQCVRRQLIARPENGTDAVYCDAHWIHLRYKVYKQARLSGNYKIRVKRDPNFKFTYDVFHYK